MSTASREGGQDVVAAPRVVARESLFERLSAAEQAGGVTLVSAPAGSGKTILLRSWLDRAGLSDRAAWVSVERDEQDAQRFWLSLIERFRSAVGADAFVETLAPTPQFDGNAVVERLVSELGSLDEPVVLVIDDLQELVSPDALASLELLLADRPSLVGIVLTTRSDPQLGLHRLRLAGQLTEIRAAELRFTLDETRELLADSGVELSDESVARLLERTEGWAAGLRLAALSLAGHPDPERFVAAFSGSERTVADYLLVEVLERQPEQVQRLLLRTSILERVNGELADLLTDGSGSEGILQALEQANAFVVALDAGRTWFRYHSLFADLLRLELRRSESDVVRELHHTAAEWYAQHGYVIEAIRHAQAADDWPYAARMLADHSLSLYFRGQGATSRALLAAFPSDALDNPELILHSANEPLLQGSLEDATARVALAARNGSAVPPERRHGFEVKLAVARLALARRRGDFGSVLGEVQSLSALLEEQAPGEATLGNEAKASALLNLGIVELWSFRREDAGRHLEQALELARRIEAPYIEVRALTHLGVLTVLQGSYASGRELSLEAIAVAEAHGWASEPFVCVAPAAVAGVEVSQGRLEEAGYWLERAEQAMPPDLEPATELLMHLVGGMVRSVRGRQEEAVDAFRAAVRLAALLVGPHVLGVVARGFLVQTLVRLGDTAAARATLAEMAEEDRDWGDSRTALASLHLADGDAEAAVKVLAPVLDGSAPALKQSPVQAFLLDALARDLLGDTQAAEESVERALERAEPNGLVFPFVITPAHALLERHPRTRTAHAALLSDILDVLAGSALPAPAGQRPELREDLTDSELRVLRFLPSNLSAPEIGRELYLSLSTIKTHMRHIYAKLDVHRRTDAVDRARQLGLLAPSARRG